MSLEAKSQPEPNLTLTLEIPSKNDPSPSPSPVHTPPSTDDSGIPTPTTTVETTQLELTTLPTTSQATASSSSLPTVNVKFAPLPELLPRKRRSSVPLGMAARAHITHRRSGYKERIASPMWTDEGSEDYRRRHEELAARHARFSAYAASAAAREEERDGDDWPHEHRRRGRKKEKEMDEVDPLLVIGRMVKVAGKSLWRRLSNKDVAAAAAAATSTPKSKEGSKGQEDGSRHSNVGLPTKALSTPVLRPILGNKSSNVDDHHVEEHEEEEEAEGGGGVWEEEIGESFPRNVSQTETIVEGRAVYSRLTSKVEVLSRSPPPSPTLLNSKRMSSCTKPPSTKNIPPFNAKLADGRS